MLSPTLIIGLPCAVLFYRAASYERMSPLLWGAASFGLTAICAAWGPGVFRILMMQAGLFCAMWGYNIWRHRRVAK